MPLKMGNFERIAPSDYCTKVISTIKSYKTTNTK